MVTNQYNNVWTLISSSVTPISTNSTNYNIFYINLLEFPSTSIVTSLSTAVTFQNVETQKKNMLKVKTEYLVSLLENATPRMCA